MNIILILSKYFILFMIYSILGYIAEVTYVSLKNKKFNPNRGFLLGPYLPIYGSSSVVMILLYSSKSTLDNIFNIFLDCMVVCTFIEYMTSFYMEKRYKVRWWDYTDKLLNINGRVCVENSLLFGIGGIIILYVVNPYVEPFVDNLSNILKIVIALILFIIYLTDNIISNNAMKKLGKSLIELAGAGDATEEIKESIYKELSEEGYIRRRQLRAYPRVRKIYKERLNKIKLDIDNARNKMVTNQEKLKTSIDNTKKEIKDSIKINIDNIKNNNKN